jgi:hypothetical protein
MDRPGLTGDLKGPNISLRALVIPEIARVQVPAVLDTPQGPPFMNLFLVFLEVAAP